MFISQVTQAFQNLFKKERISKHIFKWENTAQQSGSQTFDWCTGKTALAILKTTTIYVSAYKTNNIQSPKPLQSHNLQYNNCTETHSVIHPEYMMICTKKYRNKLSGLKFSVGMQQKCHYMFLQIQLYIYIYIIYFLKLVLAGITLIRKNISNLKITVTVTYIPHH